MLFGLGITDNLHLAGASRGFSYHCYAEDTQLSFPLDQPLSLRQNLKLSLWCIQSNSILFV